MKKDIVFMNQKAVLACDGNCQKAWGITTRSKIHLDEENVDDYAFLSDGELGIAPIDPGTDEGGDKKPVKESEKLNKWCARECERSSLSLLGKRAKTKDFSQWVYNIEH